MRLHVMDHITNGDNQSDLGSQRMKNTPSPVLCPPPPGIGPWGLSMAMPQLATYERLAAEASSRSSLAHFRICTGAKGFASTGSATGLFHIDHRLASSM